MYENSTKVLMGFLEKSHTPFHVVANVRAILKEQGFEELSEGSSWNLKNKGKYFVVRNESSVLAFRLPKKILKDSRLLQHTRIHRALRLRERGPKLRRVNYMSS